MSEKDEVELPKGMTKVPMGWPLMHEAFLGFAEFSIQKSDIVKQFEDDTGYVMNSAILKDGERRCTVFNAYLDWLVVNWWGEDGVEYEDIN